MANAGGGSGSLELGRGETLVGVATGTADGGVAIVRLSGVEAFAIAEARIGGRMTPRRLVLRSFALNEGAKEECMVVFMEGPRSFTGEDVVEFHVHGGEQNVRAVVETLLSGGAAVAGPGDFSRRAFANGRRSLDQLEGIAALIGARSRAALGQARRLVAGELGREVESVCARLSLLRIEVEAHLDFPEDVGKADWSRWIVVAAEERDRLAGWLRRFELGRRAREGGRAVLAGPPNAGKSALFNCLLGRERALVSPQAGTTRDYVEAEIDLGGRRLVLVDTAGLRAASNAVELAGVAFSEEQISGADLVLWVEAVGDSPAMVVAARERLRSETEARGGSWLDVENKRDLGGARRPWLGVSCEDGSGIAELWSDLGAWFGVSEDSWVGLARHRRRAEEGGQALERTLELLEASRAGDERLEIVALELQIAERRLGEIGGRSGFGPVGQDVLDAIFSSFCIGK